MHACCCRCFVIVPSRDARANGRRRSHRCRKITNMTHTLSSTPLPPPPTLVLPTPRITHHQGRGIDATGDVGAEIGLRAAHELQGGGADDRRRM